MPSKSAKLAPSVVDSLKYGVKELLELIVEVKTPATPAKIESRQEAAEQMKNQFEKVAVVVANDIESLGGKVLATAWINGSLRILIPADHVHELAKESAVQFIDFPRSLELE